jgi:GNAT superfamily N-acetyltransferase
VTDRTEEVEVAITFLEMDHRPEGPPPPLPAAAPVSLMRAVRPPVKYFLYLYDLVGEAHHWTDRHADDPAALQEVLDDDDVSLFSMIYDGWPAGIVMLDWREQGVCDLSYFGISERLHGMGLGRWLIGAAVRMGWEREGVRKMSVNTCSLDHPRALPMYQRAGFEPVRRVETTRRIPRRV